jgi:hypothetical protein
MEAKKSKGSQIRKVLLMLVILVFVFYNGYKVVEYIKSKRAGSKPNNESAPAPAPPSAGPPPAAASPVELELLKKKLSATERANDSLATELRMKEKEIEEKVTEIRKLVDNSGLNKLDKANEELFKLKKLAKVYKQEIEKLRQTNKALLNNNKSLSSNYERNRNFIDSLSSELQSLNTKIEANSGLQIQNLTVRGIRFKKNREVVADKVVSIEKVKVCFVVLANPLAPDGVRNIYVRMIDSKGSLLSLSDEKFRAGGGSLGFSSRQQIYYDNNNAELCLYYPKTEQVGKGKYSLEVYIDSTKISTHTFVLK